ncbi:plasmid mobilization protein [Piscinibacter koreensis]|uniref:Plasmid mobilization relaxosome protein MobC n=1 Tax=Piscinibacter koreensis TaxID=2742824 RepID=A0A7Y6NTE9_9BURK|nr:plasmid mobilization relaxosome protein MobC [Schlegelella koreensis]NUZ09009.1 plasmid mobilization relaxosome protein MobC [Schlegelella koreensis]
MTDETSSLPPKRRGGRPRSAPADLRTATIGVRVSAAEYDALRAKSAAMAMTPAQWLREAALTRRLPAPPVAEINHEQYVELARLAANLNQLTRLANEGERVTVATDLLIELKAEVKRLRFGLIGTATGGDTR